MARKTSKRQKTDRSSMKNRARQRVRDRARKTVEGKSGIQWLTLPEGFDNKNDFFEHKKGNNKITILPYEVSIKDHPEGLEVGDLWYERSVSIHYGIGANNKASVCPRTFNKKCPICEAAGESWDNGEEDEARQLWPKRRQIFNVLVDGEVKLWTLSFHLFGKKLEEEILYDEDQEFDGFYFLEKDDGYDLKVRFVEQTLGKNKFLEATKIEFLTRKKDLPEELYEDVYDLDTIIECPDYAELKELFLEEPADDDEEDEKEEKRPARKKPAKKKRRPEPEPDDDDDNEPDDDDDNEPDDDDDNEPDDDDDESEPPPKKKKSRVKKKKASGGKCPSGHEFGTDCDEYPDDCDDCDLWQDCIEEQEKG